MAFCKYCKSKEHNIDNCKEILCKTCRQYGHPHWKCKKTKNNNNNAPGLGFIRDNKYNKNKIINRNKEEENNIPNIKEYLQYMDKSWSEISAGN